MSCINKNHPDTLQLAEELNVSPAVAAAKIGLWQEKNNVEDRFPTVDELIKENEVNFALKSVDILLSDKAKQVFEKGNKNNWSLDKILSELQIPKEQKQLILDLNKTNREEIITNLLANYSYTIEINTAKDEKVLADMRFEGELPNTNYYQGMTVPGGTNYTEQEIATPAITPSIKGHAQFATNKGIGWFRSDEQVLNIKDSHALEEELAEAVKNGEIEPFQRPSGGSWLARVNSLEGNKTRRILEVQSDYFQKLRNNFKFNGVPHNIIMPPDNNNEKVYLIDENEVSAKEYNKAFEDFIDAGGDNQFLALLHKGDNWVTFFVKSIIQDSVKKGYEKVLFPTGDTASKVEGHTTLEEFKKQKEDRIKELENKKQEEQSEFGLEGWRYKSDDGFYKEHNRYGRENLTKEVFEKSLEQKQEKINNEITQLKQELERVEGPEGFGALRPVYKFYEEDVKNTLDNILGGNKNDRKKSIYKFNQITDEYGNTWNEITLEEKRDNSTIFMKKVDFTNVTSNQETNLFSNVSENLENNEEINYLTQNQELLLNSEPRLELKANLVLQNIIGSSQIDKFKEVGFFLEKSMNLLNKSGAKFKIIDNDKFNELSSNSKGVAVMLYDTVTNTIYTSKEKMSDFTPEQITEAFVHEVVHSVSVKAYFDPQTFAEHQFKQFIDEAYEQYKDLSEDLDGNGNQMYGFTNQAEFIAEIYSNPKFRNKLESLEKGWLNKLLNAIRRLLDLPKSIINNQIISSALLLNKVDSFITNEKNPYSNWKGTIIQDSRYEIFAKIDESKKTNLETIEDKINNNLDRINESLDINLKKYKKLIKSYDKKGYDTQGLRYVENNLQELYDTVNDYTGNEKILGVISFLENMTNSLNYIEKKLKDVKNEDYDKIKNIVKIQDDYLTTYNVINDIKNLTAFLNENVIDSDLINEDEITKLQELLDVNLGKYERLSKQIYELKKLSIKDKLLDIKYFPEIQKKHYDRLSIEHRNMKISYDKETWIIEQMTNRDKDLIQEDLIQEVNKFLNNPAYDIYSGDVLFNSAINVSSPMIQIMNNLFNQIDNQRIKDERVKDLEFKKLFDELVKEKGTNNVSKLYENIIEFDSTDKPFLRNEWDINFYNDVVKKINDLKSQTYFKTLELQKKQDLLISQKKQFTKEFFDVSKEIQTLNQQTDLEIEKLEKDNLELTTDDKYKPKDKWLNKNKPLTSTELKVLEFFKEITIQSAKDTYFQETLIKNGYGTSFYELPKITKSFTERMFQGETIKGLKDNWVDLTTVRPDDIGYTILERDMSGNPIYKLPIHYRDTNNNFKNSDQSLDLFNIYRLEYKNGNTFKHRNNVETDLNFLLDIAKDLKYYKNTGTSLELNSRNKKLSLLEGNQSQTFKMMTNLMESKLYDILNKNGTKIGNVELNKAVTKLNGITSFLALSLNVASGTANVLNGSAQMFLESFLKGQTIKASSIAKAESFYLKDMINIISDQTNSINISYTNQILEMFNIKGDRSLSQSNFLRSDMLKKGLNMESLQIIQSTGEHWLNSIITFSVLDGVKVMNENHEYLDKSGNIVKNYADAASVLDMLDKSENGLVNLNEKVIYTTHSKLTKWNEGGKEMIDALLYKKIYDMIGNYRSTDQSEVYRHWGGKLTMLYRKYLVPMGLARLRGIETSLKRKEDLDEKDRRFSYALQEYEEGTYTTLIRYIKSSVKNGQKWLTLKENWSNLTDYEQHNIKKAVTEIILTSILAPLAAMLAGAAADDDDQLMYFIAYQLRRLDTELSAYRSLEESFKMLRSPIPSTRLLEHGLWTVNSIVNPFAWENLTEVYETGPQKGENKFLIKQQKQIPLVKEFLKNWEDLYQFQNKPVTGFGQ